MTPNEKTGDIETKRVENKHHEMYLRVQGETNIFNVAHAIHRKCADDLRLYNLNGGNEVDCIVKTAKAEYKFHISTPHNFENLLKEVAKQIII